MVLGAPYGSRKGQSKKCGRISTGDDFKGVSAAINLKEKGYKPSGVF